VFTAFVLHLFIVYVEPLAQIFGFVALSLGNWVGIFVIVIIGFVILDLVKLAQSKAVDSSQLVG
jgi:hypothetical protein